MEKRFEKLSELINESLKDQMIFVDSIVMEKEHNYLFLKIILDKVGGLDLDAIVQSTEIINPIIDSYEIKENDYILDISSKERKSS